MKFPYYAVPVDKFDSGKPTHVAYRPLVKIILKNNNKKYETLALVDSGADNCLFPIAFGYALGLDIKSVKPEIIRGINNIKTPAYYHKITLTIRGNSIEVRCGFCDDLPIVILGQEGFFEIYDITFRYEDRYFELNLKK